MSKLVRVPPTPGESPPPAQRIQFPPKRTIINPVACTIELMADGGRLVHLLVPPGEGFTIYFDREGAQSFLQAFTGGIAVPQLDVSQVLKGMNRT